MFSFFPTSLDVCMAAVLLASTVTAQTPVRPHITGVAHIAIYAHDYEKSRAFYGQFLGFEEPYDLKNTDGTPSMTFYKVNERQYIELFPERKPETDRLNHISLETDDIQVLHAYLRSKGIKVPDEVKKGRIGNYNFNITDPEGHTVEMVQYAKDGWTVREKGKHLPPTRISQHMMHVGIIVGHLDAETKFYTDVLGFKETWRGSKSGTELSWTNLKVPDGDDYIELMLYQQPPPEAQRGTAHHLALEVPDIEASVAELKNRAYFKLYAKSIEVRTGTNRKRQANLFDPDGTRSELMEPKTIDGKPTPSSSAPWPQ